MRELLDFTTVQSLMYVVLFNRLSVAQMWQKGGQVMPRRVTDERCGDVSKCK